MLVCIDPLPLFRRVSENELQSINFLRRERNKREFLLAQLFNDPIWVLALHNFILRNLFPVIHLHSKPSRLIVMQCRCFCLPYRQPKASQWKILRHDPSAFGHQSAIIIRLVARHNRNPTRWSLSFSLRKLIKVNHEDDTSRWLG